jgi:hypothetical protein
MRRMERILRICPAVGESSYWSGERTCVLSRRDQSHPLHPEHAYHPSVLDACSYAFPRTSMDLRHMSLLAGLLVAVVARGQEVGGLALRLPASTRALAMGDAFVAGRGSEVVFYNPALLALQPGLAVAAQRYSSARTLGTVSAALGSGPWGAGVGVQMLDYKGEVGYVYPGGESPVIPVAASSLAATLAGSAQFKGVRVGLATKYVEERIGDTRTGTVVADVGAGRDVGPVSVGLAIQNVGGDLNISGPMAELPRRATLGAAFAGYPLGTYVDLAATAAVSVLRGGDVMPAGGVELTFVPLEGWAFSLRAGARRAELARQQPVTAGAGVSLDRVSLDYAYERFRGLGGAHRVGLRVR